MTESVAGQPLVKIIYRQIDINIINLRLVSPPLASSAHARPLWLGKLCFLVHFIYNVLMTSKALK